MATLLKNALAQRRLVDRHVQRGAHVLVLDRFHIARDLQHVDLGLRIQIDVELRRWPQTHRFAERQLDRDIDAPGLDRRHAGRRLRQHLEGHALDRRHTAPILVECLQHDARTALVVHELVRPSADRLGEEAFVADLLVIGLRQDIDRQEAEIEFGRRRRLRIDQHRLRRRDDLDILQVLQQARNREFLVLLRTCDPAVLHVFGGQLRAVVEEDIVAQRDLEPGGLSSSHLRDAIWRGCSFWSDE